MNDKQIFDILKNKESAGKYPCDINKILQLNVSCKKCAWCDSIYNFVNNKHKCEYDRYCKVSFRKNYDYTNINDYLPEFIYCSNGSGELMNTKKHILGNEKIY